MVTPQTVVILPRPMYQLLVAPHLVVRRPHELCPIQVRHLAGFIMLRSSGGSYKVLEEEAERLQELEEGRSFVRSCLLDMVWLLRPCCCYLQIATLKVGMFMKVVLFLNWLFKIFGNEKCESFESTLLLFD